MSSVSTIYQKDGFVFLRNPSSVNRYILRFSLSNPTLSMMNLMDFSFVKLIYDLNPDIYLTRDITIHSPSDATAVLLLKNFFEDLGLPQRYTHAFVHREILANGSIVFSSQTAYDAPKPTSIPSDALLLPLSQLICTCSRTDSIHTVEVECDIAFSGDFVIQPFAEKMIGFVLFKVFSRVKQFTEKMRM